jgi:repressor LexA
MDSRAAEWGGRNRLRVARAVSASPIVTSAARPSCLMLAPSVRTRSYLLLSGAAAVADRLPPDLRPLQGYQRSTSSLTRPPLADGFLLNGQPRLVRACPNVCSYECQIYTNKCSPSSGPADYHVEHMFDSLPAQGYDAGSNGASSMAMSCGPLSETEASTVSETLLTGKRREILDFIAEQVRERGYPPSVREIGLAVGLASTSTVQAHLNTLQRQGYLRRDPTKPRALEVRYDATSGAAIERRPARHVPLVGDIAAGTNVLASENVEELLPLPDDFTGGGSLFMLRVRGDSMVEAGILDGDYVVVRQQPDAVSGDVVAAGIPGGEATVKTFSRRGDDIVLLPANPTMGPMEFPASDVTIYGKVVTVLRRL